MLDGDTSGIGPHVIRIGNREIDGGTHSRGTHFNRGCDDGSCNTRNGNYRTAFKQWNQDGHQQECASSHTSIAIAHNPTHGRLAQKPTPIPSAVLRIVTSRSLPRLIVSAIGQLSSD